MTKRGVLIFLNVEQVEAVKVPTKGQPERRGRDAPSDAVRVSGYR